MTTAHRPTFETARGGQGFRERDLSAQSKQYSSRDLPGHTRLKQRQDGQGTAEEARAKDFRRDLDDRERRHRAVRGGDAEEPSSSSSSSKRQRLEQAAHNPDADDLAVAAVDIDDDDEDDEDDEDETAELMAELQKIKRERAAEAAKLDAERHAEEERIRTENILRGNPLRNKLQQQQQQLLADPQQQQQQQQQLADPQQQQQQAAAAPAEFKVKRRWNDDVVFKNCARDEDKEAAARRGFVNDTLRSEFHKKFMDKYIK